MKPEEYYSEIIEASRVELSKLRRRAFAVAMSRLAVFVATVAICFWVSGAALVSCIAVAGLVLFLYLAKYSGRIEQARFVEQAKIDSSENNLRRLRRELDGLSGGDEYIDTNHDFTYDIDVFGSKSLYALLNATSTAGGAHMLAQWLINPLKVSDRVEARQSAIKELSENDKFRLEMASVAKVSAEDAGDAEKESDIPGFSIGAVWKTLVAAVPIIYIVLFALFAFSLIPGIYIFYFFLLVLAAGSVQAKRVGSLHEWLYKFVKPLSAYSGVFRTIENERFESEILTELQRRLIVGGKNASQATAQLAHYIHNLDQRYNVFGYAIMNGFLLWDFRQLHNIDRWMTKNGEYINSWKETIAEFDAFCALAVFKFNNQKYVFPSLDKNGTVVMRASAAGHPLLLSDKCVCNDVDGLTTPSFFVITGANMAGKSTYLRTVAVNYLLALIGAPVFASEMTFYPMTLYTGLRTADSLSKGASYFFAELSRLQQMVQRAESGERMFVLLDEILRGTNSDDKQRGSLGLVRKLVGLPVAGMIATHDLSLGSLADKFPQYIRNYRFESELDGDKLKFSYRILPGIARNTNATFLMKTMGII